MSHIISWLGPTFLPGVSDVCLLTVPTQEIAKHINVHTSDWHHVIKRQGRNAKTGAFTYLDTKKYWQTNRANKQSFHSRFEAHKIHEYKL